MVLDASCVAMVRQRSGNEVRALSTPHVSVSSPDVQADLYELKLWKRCETGLREEYITGSMFSRNTFKYSKGKLTKCT